MKRRALQEWMGRIGWAAALLLLVMPTAGRLLQASAEGGHDRHHATTTAAAPAPANRSVRATPSPSATGDGAAQAPGPIPDTGPDCDYCPLLGSLATMAHVRFFLPGAPDASSAPGVPGAPRIARLHPNGLGSRGPPIRR